MAFDDESEKVELAKRRLVLFVFVLLGVIILTALVLFLSGYIYREPVFARAIMYIELAMFIAFYALARRNLPGSSGRGR